MAIESVTDLRNTDPGQTAFTVRNNPVGGSTACHAMQVTQAATSGDGAGVNVVSNNSDAPAIRARSAGPLIQLYDSSNTLKFSVSNTGAVALSDALTLPSLTTTGNASVGGTLGVTGATTLSSTLGVTGATTLNSTLGVTGATTITGDLTLQGTGKAYRLRRSGSALDLDATGVDLLISNFSGTNFDGTQRSYLRLSADAQNIQVAGKTEFVDALYGTAKHTLDASTGVASVGSKNSLTNTRFCGTRASAGAPSTGTWVAGDTVLDSTGIWHLCTTGGTPGTWVTSHNRDLPSEQNLLAWTYNPDMAGHVTAQSNGGVAGRLTLVRLPIRSTITWSNIWIGLAGVDAGASLSNCYLGVYDTNGTLLGTTADISSSLMSGATAKALPLATPFTATPGMYFIAMLLNGTWTTNSLTFKASGAGISVNAGLTAPNLRYSNMLTAQTSLPSSITLANQLTSIINTGWASQWYGVS